MTRTVHIVEVVNNRDQNCTIITTDQGIMVEVDPTELFVNMVENLSGDTDILDQVNEFIQQVL